MVYRDQKKYTELHRTIKRQTGIPKHVILPIRTIWFKEKLSSQRSLAEWAATKLNLTHNKRRHPKSYYQEILNHIAQCPPGKWELIVQPISDVDRFIADNPK